jgi:hypothetical protein
VVEVKGRYCFISDGDHCTWLCPLDRELEGQKIVDDWTDYWMDRRDPVLPRPTDPDAVGWLHRQDGMSGITFENPEPR